MQQGFGRGHGGGGLRACVYFVSFVRDGRSRADFFPARPQVLKSLTSVARAVAELAHVDGPTVRNRRAQLHAALANRSEEFM
jgi:hypothetical protein